jgi:CBS domain-containing protein
LYFVFSSQNYLFPEAPLYLISTLLTSGTRATLFLNGVLNVVALYALLRTIAHQLAHRARHQLVEVSISLAATTLFVVFVLLESGSPHQQVVATLFLFTTYYYGVILSGLAVVALTLWVSRAFGCIPWGRGRMWRYAIAVVLITMLTSFTDPLYLLQVVLPLAIVFVLLLLLNRLTWRQLFVLAAPTAVGVVFAYDLRSAYSRSFMTSIGSYLDIGQIPDSVNLLISYGRSLLHTPQGIISVLLLGGSLLVTAALLVFALYAQARPGLAGLIATSEVFIVGFVSISFFSLTVGLVLTGSTTTRYIEPIYLFPLLTLVSVGVFVLRRLLIGVKRAELRRSLRRFAAIGAAAAAVLIIVVGSVSIAPVARAASGSGYTGARCFDRFIGKSEANGVGSYWTVRSLSLYGDSRGAILQADALNKRLTAYA